MFHLKKTGAQSRRMLLETYAVTTKFRIMDCYLLFKSIVNEIKLNASNVRKTTIICQQFRKIFQQYQFSSSILVRKSGQRKRLNGMCYHPVSIHQMLLHHKITTCSDRWQPIHWLCAQHCPQWNHSKIGRFFHRINIHFDSILINCHNIVKLS